jgi:hypothetical protein
MKRYIVESMFLVFAFVLVACGCDDAEEAEPTEAATTEETAPEEEAEPVPETGEETTEGEEPAVSGDMSLLVQA